METEVVSAEAATKGVVMEDVAALAVEAALAVALAVEVVDLPVVAGSAVDLLVVVAADLLVAVAVDLLAEAVATLTQVLSCPAWTPTATGLSTSANNRDRHSS